MLGVGGEPCPAWAEPDLWDWVTTVALTSLNSCVGLRSRRHGQGTSMTGNHIGVDLSQGCSTSSIRFAARRGSPNRPGPIARWLAGLGPEDVLVFEATSGCDRALIAALSARGQDFARLNPLHAWHFAQSLNLAKTDRVDARMLARLGAERRPEPTPAVDHAREELRQLSQRRDSSSAWRQERNAVPVACRWWRATSAPSRYLTGASARSSRRSPITSAAIPLRCGDRSAAHDPRPRPGHAVELVAHLPELGQTDRRGVASLAGLAPKARELGQVPRQALPRRGKAPRPKALYMAALSACATTASSRTSCGACGRGGSRERSFSWRWRVGC